MAIVAAMLASAAILSGAPADAGQAEALKRAADRGALIYEFDQAAWVSTDALVRISPNPAALGVKGWIVERQNGLDHVIYYALNGAAPTAVFSAEVNGKQVVSTHLFEPEEDRSLSAVERRMVAARSAKLAEPLTPCTAAAFNAVVIPPDAPGGPITVYLLSAQTERNVYPLGGHFSYQVDAAGSVIAQRAFTKSCLTGEFPANAVAAVSTDVLDELPNEIQVYLSLWMEKPYFVAMVATGQIWKIDGQTITPAKVGSKELPSLPSDWLPK